MQCWYISWGFVNHDIMGGGNMGKAQRAKAHEDEDLGAGFNESEQSGGFSFSFALRCMPLVPCSNYAIMHLYL